MFYFFLVFFNTEKKKLAATLLTELWLELMSEKIINDGRALDET